MRVRVLGAGVYGCHIASALIAAGHEVEVHEIGAGIMQGASGNIPARLHQGFHYPRSHMTRAACRDHQAAFMAQYGEFTRGVPVNLYAIAEGASLVDFDQYRSTLAGEVEFITVEDPTEFGLTNVEGALLTGERHIVTDMLRAHFEDTLGHLVHLHTAPDDRADGWDWTIDCTFCANDDAGVDRYEPCLVLLLEGPTGKAVTIMDGPFASLYPWRPDKMLSSLSSARWSPLSKECRTYEAARRVLDQTPGADIAYQGERMIESMATYFPAILDQYEIAEHRLSIRAMPVSAADTRLVDVQFDYENGNIRVRAGKIDAIVHAADQIVKALA